MIFGYDPIDLILFDTETLHALLTEFFYRNLFFILAGLILNIFFSFRMHKLSTHLSLYVLVSFGWFYSGYFYYLGLFEPIYWVSKYVAYFCFFMSALCFGYLFFNYQQFKILLRWRAILFSLVTLSPALLSYLYNSKIVLAIGTSSMVAALGTLALVIGRKQKSAIALTLLSGLWLTVLLLVAINIE